MASAEQMLHDIQSESLQKLLTRVQQLTRLFGPTGIPALDTHLSRSTSGCQHALSDSKLSGNDIRIQGPPGCGKTHLLYFLLATCVMPLKHLSCFVGGWNKVAFVMDLDGHFQMSRFHKILVNGLERNHIQAASMPSIVERCMRSLHIFRPSSSAQLAVTLAHLHSYHSAHFPCQEIGMVAIHSIDAFYWLDRYKIEQLRPSLSTKSAYPDTILSILQELRTSYGLTSVVSLWGLPQQLSDINRNKPNATHHEETPGASAATIVLCAVPKPDHSSPTQSHWHVQMFDQSESSQFSFEVAQGGITMQYQ